MPSRSPGGPSARGRAPLVRCGRAPLVRRGRAPLVRRGRAPLVRRGRARPVPMAFSLPRSFIRF